MLFTFEKWSFAHARGGVSGVALFITTDEQLQKKGGCCFLVQAMLPEGFPFHQFFIDTFNKYTKMMLQYLHAPRKQQFLMLNSYLVNINTCGSNQHVIQFNKMAAAVGARHAREARVTAAGMVTTQLIITVTRVRWIAARHVLTTEVVILANLKDN